jgi:hypothetical protein
MKVKISLVVVFATLIAATWAFGDGFNLVSTPLIPHDSGMQAFFADSMGTGCQLTGGYPATASDQVKWFDTATSIWYSAYYKVGGPGPQNIWQGTLTSFEADRGHWIIIKGTHPAVTLTMTGDVNSSTRTISIQPGLSFNFVGTTWATVRKLSGGTGDDCNLLGSGMTSGYPATGTDNIRYFDGSIWYTAYHKVGGPGPQNVWQGRLSGTQTLGDPEFDPGNGYIIQVQAGNAFTGNQWLYTAAPAKGATTVLSSKTRAVAKRDLHKTHRALGPSTNKSLAPEKTVESKRTR